MPECRQLSLNEDMFSGIPAAHGGKESLFGVKYIVYLFIKNLKLPTPITGVDP